MHFRGEKGITEAKIIFCIIAFFVIIGLLIELIDDGVETSADGFTISSYDVSLEVKDDNIVNVTEDIWVNWYEGNHHGIYKFTPEWLEYTGKDKKTIKRKSVVSNYQAVGQKYSIDVVKKKPRIKIGDANTFVNKGLKNYVIRYTYDMGKDPFNGRDEFIFHFFGDYWGTEIENPRIKVKMPKEFDENKVKFFTDKYRNNDVTDFVYYYVSSDNTLNATFDGERYYDKTGNKLDKSLTLDIELPEGYFEGGSWNYGYGSVIFSIIIIALTGVVIILWIRYGKDLEKENKTIEFYPPDDLTSAEIGYIYGNKNIKKLTISLIISIAAKGYIKIDKLEDNKIQITSNIGIKPKKPKKDENDFKNYSEELKEYNLKKSRLKPLNKHEKIVYNRLFQEGSPIILSEHKKFYKVFESLDKEIKKNIKAKIRDTKSDSKIIIGAIITIITFIMSLISFFGFEDMDPSWSILYKLSFICVVINLLLTIFMGRKTKYGETITARVNGFRDFLNTAEKYRLEELVEDNPQYFYNILPYTYVFGISKKWMRDFENIQMPQVDMGNFDYSSDGAWTSFNNSIYIPTTTTSSGGGSSCGGGCSSCGGGCSSCGGGGSW